MAKIDQAVKEQKEKERPRTMAEVLADLSPIVRRIEPMVELDFSFYQDAITMCDMEAPSVMRRGVLYTRAEIEDNLHKNLDDLGRRVNVFMRRV